MLRFNNKQKYSIKLKLKRKDVNDGRRKNY